MTPAPSLAAPAQGPTACRLCGASLVGPYCHACGQASTGAPRSFREVFMGQTGRLLHTLRLLFTRPGELAREIDEGRDRHSMRPLTLLLNLIPLFFLLGGGPGGFGAKAFTGSDPSGRLDSIIAAQSQKRSVSLPVFEERIEQRFRAVYSLLVVVQVASYGAAIGMVERRRRKPWLVHFAAAIHYMCFSFILSTVIFAAFRLAGGTLMAHPAVAGVAMLINMTYMGLTLRRVYADSVALTLGKTVVIMALNYLASLALTALAVLIAVATA